MSIKSNLNDAEMVAAAAGVGESYCELNHGPDTIGSDYTAANMLIIPIGRRISESELEEVRKLFIPVCHECAEGLNSDEWTLVYCLECASNHWIYRPLARLQYRHHVLWLKGCPDCTGKFGGIYFSDTDFPNAPSEDI